MLRRDPDKAGARRVTSHPNLREAVLCLLVKVICCLSTNISAKISEFQVKGAVMSPKLVRGMVIPF